MKIKAILFLFSLVFLIPISVISQTNSIPVIPQPNQVTSKAGQYFLNNDLIVSTNDKSLDQLSKY